MLSGEKTRYAALGDRAWQHGNIPVRQEGIGPPLPGSICRVCQGRAARNFRLKVLITGEERLFWRSLVAEYGRYLRRVLPDLALLVFILRGGLITVWTTTGRMNRSAG